MKNSLMNLYDKIMLRKRAVIETVNDELKNVCHIEHTRHRSIDKEAEAEQRIQELTHIIFEKTEEAEQKQQALLSLEKQLATYKDIKE